MIKMALKMFEITLETLVVLIILLFIPIVRCNNSYDHKLIPANRARLGRWFDHQVLPAMYRTSSLEPSLAAAEATPATMIIVSAGGGGHFKSITEAVNSVPDGNQKRVIIFIRPGYYIEKVIVDRRKPFITLYGDHRNMPVLVYNDTAAERGTVDSATLIVESDFFSAVNLKVVNSAPRPDGIRKDAQAAAMRISGDAASFYNCGFYGYQDTLCDDRGNHFFKDCYVEGTVDFIFGSGKSIYLNSEIHAIPGGPGAVITAQARKKYEEDNGFIFVLCNVTGGEPGRTFLGRPWFACPLVVYAFTELSHTIHPQGWSDNKLHNAKSAFFGEYKNNGPGAKMKERAPFVKKLSDADVKPFISLDFLQGSKWLLPVPPVNV